MEEELYVYEEQKRAYGRGIYTVRRKAKRAKCWDCGLEWLMRKDRRCPQFCRECAIKGKRNPQFGKEAWNKGKRSNFNPKDYHREYVKYARREKKKKLILYLGNKCWRCHQENFPICVWDFHHLDSQKKDISISQILTYSWTKILKETKKCVLVCGNCHRIIHWGEETPNGI